MGWLPSPDGAGLPACSSGRGGLAARPDGTGLAACPDGAGLAARPDGKRAFGPNKMILGLLAHSLSWAGSFFMDRAGTKPGPTGPAGEMNQFISPACKEDDAQ